MVRVGQCLGGGSRGRPRYVAARYISAGLFAVEALALARLLGPMDYGDYALVSQIAVLILFSTIGSNAGYVYSFYKSADPDLDRQYLVGATAQFLAGGIICAAVLAVWRPLFVLGAVQYLLQMPYYITEPMLRVRNRFTLAVVGRSIGVLLTVLFIGVWLTETSALSLRAAIGLMIGANIVGCAVYCSLLIKCRAIAVRRRQLADAILRRATWRGYWCNVLRPGIPLNTSSILLLVFTSVDRLFIEHFRSATALGVYSLAWQLSQGALLMLSSMNVVTGVRLGERIATNSSGLGQHLREQLTVTAWIGGLGYGTVAIVALALSRTLFTDYEELVTIVLLLNAGYSVLHVVGSVTGLLSFERRARELNMGYAGALGAGVLGNIVSIRFGLWYGVPVAISSMALIVLNVWFAYHTRGIARQLEAQVPAVGLRA